MFELIGKITYLFNKMMQYKFNYLVFTVNKVNLQFLFEMLGPVISMFIFHLVSISTVHIRVSCTLISTTR